MDEIKVEKERDAYRELIEKAKQESVFPQYLEENIKLPFGD